jgi:hypothetical protein
MKILFTILSIEDDAKMYLTSAKTLTQEILNQTNHDVLISTNNVDFFSDIQSNRVIVRDNILKDSTLNYNSVFNYNLKHFAFENLPDGYDCLIYLDCDIKLEGWNNNSESYIVDIMNNYDFGATRLNCYLGKSIIELNETGRTLFSHKINSYKIRENYSQSDDIMNSQLPSEHFLIFKYETEKLKKFQERWKEMNDHLQSINGDGGSWGDGFEIGISARYAGFHNTNEISHSIWDGVLGFKFNGNKYNEIIDIDELKLNVNNLTELANKFGSDKGTEHFERHSYTEIYQKILMDYVDKKIKMLEIGVNDERFPGASIKMWKSFFNDVDFIGFDINELTKEYEKYGVKIFIGDQGNGEDLENLIKTHDGNFDVIIDDGSHQHAHHILTFSILEPYLNQGGVYIIEDLHAYDGNLTKDWFINKNIKTKLLCNNKLLIYEK